MTCSPLSGEADKQMRKHQLLEEWIEMSESLDGIPPAFVVEEKSGCDFCSGRGCSTCPYCLGRIYEYDHPGMESFEFGNMNGLEQCT
jgi:hypothetical protein